MGTSALSGLADEDAEEEVALCENADNCRDQAVQANNARKWQLVPVSTKRCQMKWA